MNHKVRVYVVDHDSNKIDEVTGYLEDVRDIQRFMDGIAEANNYSNWVFERLSEARAFASGRDAVREADTEEAKVVVKARMEQMSIYDLKT